MKLSKDDLGHWEFFGTFPKNIDRDNCFGFVYVIENTVTNQFYIGKKQFRRLGSKRSKFYGREVSWRSYTGSSTVVNADIKKLGKDKFKFTMIDVYYSKGGLYYAEAYCQMILGVMTEYLPCGKLPRFYNRQIAAIRFVPKESPSANTLKFIKYLKRKLNVKSN